MSSKNIIYRMAYKDEWQDAMGLAWQVFMKYDAPDYTPEGIESFREFVTDETLHRMFLNGGYQVFLAFDAGEDDSDNSSAKDEETSLAGDDLLTRLSLGSNQKRLIGLITLRDSTHISLLFVDGKYQRQGVGSRLIEEARNYILTEIGGDKLTVNASPYGVGFYHKRGFVDLDTEKVSDGIRYTPMVFYL